MPRNLTDAQLEAVGKNGGAVCVNFFVGFLDEKAYDEIHADDATRLPVLTAELLRRGMSEGDVRKVLGENLLRVLDETTPQRP